MQLGGFSVSLNVKDLQTSKEFYEKLGFSVFTGEESQKWLIMKNGDCNIGLFQGMFDKNIITFNPGWDTDAAPVEPFTDIRQLQKELKGKGVELVTEADETTEGPASFTLLDPDGNPIFFDQHV